MRRLVEDLLQAGRAESGHFEIERRKEAIDSLVDRSIRPFREMADRQGVSFEVEVPGEPLHVEADALRVTQVLGNLLSNALRFTSRGGRIRLTVAPSEEGAVVTVTDTGTGVEAEDLPHLFEPFWQARRTRQGGAGLGLAIAREIVTAHGGRLWVESEPGRGSSFRFTLPLARPRLGAD
jgi:signal transduction histidine kinase